MYIISFLIGGLVGGLIGIYYFSKFIFRFINEFTKVKVNRNIKIVTYVFLTFVAFFTSNMFSIITNVYMHVLLITILYEGLNYFLKKYKIYRILFYSGILPILTVMLIFGYGYYNMNNIVKTEYLLSSNKVEGLKILQVTDLHINNSLTTKELEKEVVKMNKQNADIVVLTGDIFDHYTTMKDMKETCRILGTIKNKKGIYYVYGNHERNRTFNNSTITEEDIREAFEENDVIVLKDELYTFENITIVGRMDAGWSRQGIVRKEIGDLLADVDLNNYIIVLDHQPLGLKENAKAGADLQLSGHTHGGQYFPAGPIEALLSGNLVYGKRTIGDFTAITSSGISGWGAPFKTGAPSEYVLVIVD